jgi:hypothetical protein
MEYANMLRGKVDSSMHRNQRLKLWKYAAEGALFSTVLAFALDFSRPAFAYLDPGTGSIMLQLLLGGTAGAVVVGKLYWHKLKGFFVRDTSGEDPQEKDIAPGE